VTIPPSPSVPPTTSGAHAAPPPAAPVDYRAPYDVGEVSVGDLIGNVTRDLSTLMRQELALAQAELKQEASKTAKGAGAFGGAALAAFFVVLFLSLALWAGLSNVMDAGWAGLIVALIWAVIAAVLFVTGRSKLRQVNPKPERTVDTLSHVPDALKGQRGGTA
jgi:Putative Actinobacterial Holin-X, holin superfamily III